MTFRYARHTNNLEKIKNFYTLVLGLDLLGKFENHNDYNGIFLGNENENWHLEFTQTNEIVHHSFNEDDILVFYPNSKTEYVKILETIQNCDIKFIESKNPYWNENGKMILDPDGFRVIISNLKIN